VQHRDLVGIAFAQIRGNPLRTFFTLLGIIVSVAFLIAVVAIIQGMNAYVTDAIVTDVGADNFTIQRNPVVRTAADEERVRSNPPITADDAAAVRKYDEHILAVATQGNSRTRITYKGKTLDSVQVQGVSREYIFFSTFDAERGRPISPTEVDRHRPVAILGYDTAEQLFGPADPIDKMVRIGNTQRARRWYLSHEDGKRFFTLAVESPMPEKFAVVYALSVPPEGQPPLGDPEPARRMIGFEAGSDPSGPCELVRIVDYPSPYGSSRVSTDGCPTAPDLHAATYSYFLVSRERLRRREGRRGAVALDEFEAACRSGLTDASKDEICDF